MTVSALPPRYGCFADRDAVVTGAAGGMGGAIARRLASEGARLRLLDIRAPADDPPIAADWRIGDLADEGFAREALAGLERVDLLVNAAGVIRFGEDVGVAEIDMTVWDAVFDANLRSAVNMLRAAMPGLKRAAAARGQAAIVNIATTQCLRGDPKPQDAYQASKAGLVALTKSVAIQHAADGVRANSLIPGPADTGMQARWRADPALKAATEAAIPLGRVAAAEDLAEACLFLLSDAARHVTATELVVDGGALALP